MARRRPPPERAEVSMEIDGKKYVGHYSIDRKVMTVTYGLGRKIASLSSTPPDLLAAMLLSELVSAEKRLWGDKAPPWAG
jgi:hypothetical protein